VQLTPECGEEQDLNDGKRDKQLTTTDVAGRQLIVRGTTRSEQEVTAETSNDGTDDFASTTDEQHLSSTEPFDEPEGGNASGKGDHTQNELDLVRVETGVGLSEESGTLLTNCNQPQSQMQYRTTHVEVVDCKARAKQG
jgi:hypothetical protein